MKALVIGLGLTVAAGAGWYLVSDKNAPEDKDRTVTDDAPRERRRAAREPAADRDDPPARHDGTLEQRVARLESEVATLRRQLSLRGKVSLSSGSSADVESIVDDPVLDQQVRDIFEDERQAERERRNERRVERFEEFRTEALDELQKVAGLSDTQRESIDGLWATEGERIIPLFSEARSGDRSFREVRDEIEGIRKETDDAARELLTETQFENYQELRPRGPGRRGRDGDGRERGDRGRGGPPD